MIRAGTCGAMRAGIQDGDLVIGTGAIREDGTSDKLVPIQYPAIADRHLVAALAASAASHDHRNHEGIILTQGQFYQGILPSTLELWLKADAGVCAVEMELATLLVIASLHGVQAGGIFTSDGNLTEEADPTAYDPHRNVVEEGVRAMLKITLEALVKLP